MLFFVFHIFTNFVFYFFHPNFLFNVYISLLFPKVCTQAKGASAVLVPINKPAVKKSLIGLIIFLVLHVAGHNCRENSMCVPILSRYFLVLKKNSLRWVIIHVVYTEVTCLHVDQRNQRFGDCVQIDKLYPLTYPPFIHLFTLFDLSTPLRASLS